MNILKVKKTQNGFIVNDSIFVPNTNTNLLNKIDVWVDNGGKIEQGDKFDKISNIPTKVTLRQAKLALYKIGLLESVNSIIASPNVPTETKIEWESANDIERQWVDSSGLLTILGLEKEQVDDLFRLAGTFK